MGTISDLSCVQALVADGGVIGQNGRAPAGTWAYRLLIESDVVTASEASVLYQNSGVITAEAARVAHVTNNLTELIALVRPIIEVLPEGWSGVIASDSSISLGRLFYGWARENVPEWLVTKLAIAREKIQLRSCTRVLLDGHPTRAQLSAGLGKRGNPVSPHNVWCDTTCTAAAKAWRSARIVG